jgi:hypothetical protein
MNMVVTAGVKIIAMALTATMVVGMAVVGDILVGKQSGYALS